MSYKIAINGFGRIGRRSLRARPVVTPRIQVVAVNDITDAKTLAHLLKYDSNYGHFGESVEPQEGALVIGGDKVVVTAIRNPAEIPWGQYGAEIVVESTGLFTDAPRGRDAPARHGEEGDHLRPGQGRGHHHRARRQREQVRPSQAQHHLQRLLHHELPGAGGQGDPRELRHRARA